jgi:hypothetical protein
MCRQRLFHDAVLFARTDLIQSAYCRPTPSDVGMSPPDDSLGACSERRNRYLRAAQWTNAGPGGGGGVDGAAASAQEEHHVPFGGQHDLTTLMRFKLKEVVGLFACPDPNDDCCPLSYLYLDGHREMVAKRVNQCLLDYKPLDMNSLERAIAEWRTMDHFSQLHNVFVPLTKS